MLTTDLARSIFESKYKHEGAETWEELANTLVEDVCRDKIPKSNKDRLKKYISEMKFVPGGRYLYYAGRNKKYFNNCFLLRAEEDTREDWANLSWKAESCLMSGGGIGVDYSRYRGSGEKLSSTGGLASGPIDKMDMINSIGQHVMQGGSRRSAMYASLHHSHPDVEKFLHIKDHDNELVPGLTFKRAKELNPDVKAPLDMTNISVNYDDSWEPSGKDSVFYRNVMQAMKTGEPGFSFNFGSKKNETLRNACCEVTSEDDSDVCNLGSINMARVESLEEFMDIVTLGTSFLFCGTFVADLPYKKVYEVRERNRRLGLGLMGIHEWLLKRGYKYEPNQELTKWLAQYVVVSDQVAKQLSSVWGTPVPKGVRSIAPTGTLALLASTTSGIEPVYATAYVRRYLKNNEWQEQYVIDPSADLLIKEGISPDSIETALDLAETPERRIMFQAYLQGFVDQGISSTLNLPAWGTEFNNEDKVEEFAAVVRRWAPSLRGLTMYPDGARGGQPIRRVPYEEARKQRELEYVQHDSCKGGVCGV